MVLSSASLLSLHRLPVLCHDHLRHRLRWKGIEQTPVPPLTGVECLGCLANSNPHTGHEPNFCPNMNEERTPINLPDTNSITEDPEGFPHLETVAVS